MASLYFHIPFCLRKCPYCDFVSFAADGVPEAYVGALLKEMELRASQPAFPLQANTLYFGGGTPSLLPPAAVEKIVDQAAKLFSLHPQSEVTLEANPGTVTYENLQGYLAAGVNRLSLGVQSLDDELLKRIGRVHDADEALKSFWAARRAGFTNVGIDLIHSLPGQTHEMWQAALRQALELEPEHISAYALTVEEGTPFAAMEEKGDAAFPDDDSSARMFAAAAEVLAGAGYEHYEISNFARPGYRSHHNQTYWRRGDYIGFGVGAHSFLRKPSGGMRWQNTESLSQYVECLRQGVLPEEGIRQLSLREAISEALFLGLRMSEGVDLSCLRDEIGASPRDFFSAEIDDLLARGSLETEGPMLRIRRDALVVSNAIFIRFV